MAKNKRETLAQTSKSADKTPSLALMIGLPTPFNPNHANPNKKKTKGFKWIAPFAKCPNVSKDNYFEQ